MGMDALNPMTTDSVPKLISDFLAVLPCHRLRTNGIDARPHDAPTMSLFLRMIARVLQSFAMQTAENVRT